MLPLTKRQREILDYLNDFIQQHGYAPSLEEIGQRFSLSSLATVHKHLTNLQDKGFIKRAWNRSRSVELVPTRMGGRAVELPLLGFVGRKVAPQRRLDTEEWKQVGGDAHADDRLHPVRSGQQGANRVEGGHVREAVTLTLPLFDIP